MKTLVIKSGTLITASETFQADILVEGEKIAVIGHDIKIPESAEVIDASGKLVMPGGIDVHTHLELPMFDTVSSDDHYTGHKAAAFGGTTTVLDFISQDKESLRANVDAWHAKADDKAAVDYSFHMNITKLNPQVERDIPLLIDEGITSLKVFMAYNNRLRLGDAEIYKVMRIAHANGMLTMLHAENGDVIELLTDEALKNGQTSPVWHALTRPAWGAVDATLRGIALAAQTCAPLYIVHMNVAGEVDQLKYARDLGLPVMGETVPPYLFFTVDDLKREDGSKWICSPPVRTAEDSKRLWEGLSEGTIQTIGTDHCPFFYDGTKPIEYEGEKIAIPGKELGAHDFTKIPNGLPGVGDRLPILWTYGVVAEKITANQFVNLTSTNPAKIFGMYPNKGSLIPGADADIVIWDTKCKIKYGVSQAKHRTDYNLYEGWELTGFPEKTILRGNVIVDGNEWKGKPGSGRFIRRQPFASLV